MTKVPDISDIDVVLRSRGEEVEIDEYRALARLAELVGEDPEEWLARGDAPAKSADADSAIARLAARLEPAMRREFVAAARAATSEIDLESLEAAVREGEFARVERAAKLEVLSREVRRRLPPLVARAFAAGAAAGSVAVEDAPGDGERAAKSPGGMSFGLDLRNAEAIAWVRRRGAELVTEIGDAARAAIRDALVAAQQRGRSPGEIARLIQEIVGLHSRQVAAVRRFMERLFDAGVDPGRIAERGARYAAALLRQRALLIARTETIRAASAGQDEIWRRAVQAGYLDPEKIVRVWRTAQDDRVDLQICEPLDDAEAALDEPFPGGYMYPPDPHPGCRCSVSLRSKPATRI